MIVATVQASNYAGRGRRYAETIHAQVRRHLPVPFEFHCFTDDPEPYADGIVKRELPHPELKGWSNKLALFKPGVFEPGERVVLMDLDTFIVDQIDFLATYRGRFAMLGPFFTTGINPVFAGPQSALMAWAGGFGASEIWQPFVDVGYPDTRGGDQKFINDLDLGPDLFQQMFPGKIASYKGACMAGVPEGVAVVGFHGWPRPHQAGGWARKVWRDGAGKSA